MELERVGMAKELWQMLRKILRDGELMKHDSELRKTANLFEDELYAPPKSEQGDSKTSVQQTQPEILLHLQKAIIFLNEGDNLNTLAHINSAIAKLQAGA